MNNQTKSDTSVSSEIDQTLKMYVSYSDGFNAYVIDEDKMSQFEQAIEQLLVKARLEEVNNIPASDPDCTHVAKRLEALQQSLKPSNERSSDGR